MTPTAARGADRAAGGAGPASLAVRALAWLVAAVVLAGLALRPVAGDRIFVSRYTGYAMPWLLLGLVPGALWAWRARQRALAAVLGACAAVVVAHHVPHGSRPRVAAASPAAVTLKVMSYNTFSRNGDARRIAGVIRAYAPDVLLLQEIRAPVFERVVEHLRDLYGGAPVHRAYDPRIMQGVISRHPVEPRESLEEKGQAQKVVVHLPDGRAISVLNVHPLRTGGWSRRYAQITALLEEDVLRERGPVILGGDFNAPDHSQLYRAVARHLANAHQEAGSGFGFTYPSQAVGRWRALPVPALVRIDHVFFSAHFAALRAGTLEDSGGSDHRPVFAELALE